MGVGADQFLARSAKAKRLGLQVVAAIPSVGHEVGIVQVRRPVQCWLLAGNIVAILSRAAHARPSGSLFVRASGYFQLPASDPAQLGRVLLHPGGRRLFLAGPTWP